MNKKILTINDLITFCENQNFNTFNSKESGYQICVSLPATFEKTEDINDDSMFYGNVKLLHCGVNRNHSCVTEEAAKKCMDTIAYKPILANFTDVNGDLDFTSHDFDINEDGSITYFEKQVGCFTADKPYMKQDPKHEDRRFVYAKCAIPRQYTAAADIIERKGGTKVSAELAVNDMSYSVDEGLLLNDVEVLGCTLLGVDPDTGQQILEGMESAYLQIEDFSAENNSVIFNKSELIDEITQAVINKLDNHNAAKYAEDNTTERRDDVAMDNENIKDVEFEETEVDETKVEATEEEGKVLTDETAETPEVVDKFADDDPEDGSGDPDGDDTEEGNGDPDGEPNTESTTSNTEGGTEPGAGSTTEPTTPTTPTTEPNTPGAGSNTEPGAGGGTGSNTPGAESNTGSNTGANTPNTGSGAEPNTESNTGSNTDSEGQSVSAIEDEDSTGTVKIKNSLKYSVTINGVTKEFAVSLAEKINAVELLVNSTYSESDNAYYCVDVYEDPEKYCVMHDWWNNRHFKQEYAVKKDVYTLKGDRVKVTMQFLTDDQIAELDRMRSNYSAIETELNSYKHKELHSLREEVLASEDYTVLKNDKDFKDLKENMDNYSVEELTNKADLIFAKFMKSHKNFSAATNNTARTVFMNTNEGNTSEEKLPYGGLFKNFKSKR